MSKSSKDSPNLECQIQSAFGMYNQHMLFFFGENHITNVFPVSEAKNRSHFSYNK